MKFGVFGYAISDTSFFQVKRISGAVARGTQGTCRYSSHVNLKFAA